MKKIIFLTALFFSFSASAEYFLQNPIQHNPRPPIAGSVTTTSGQIIASNILRTGLSCSDLGSAPIFVAYGSNAAILNGGTVIAAGATWWMDDYLFTNQAINMISSAAVNVACTEFQ